MGQWKKWQDGVSQDTQEVQKAKTSLPDWWDRLAQQVQNKSTETRLGHILEKMQPVPPAQSLAKWARALMRRTILGRDRK